LPPLLIWSRATKDPENSIEKMIQDQERGQARLPDLEMIGLESGTDLEWD